MGIIADFYYIFTGFESQTTPFLFRTIPFRLGLTPLVPEDLQLVLNRLMPIKRGNDGKIPQWKIVYIMLNTKYS